MLALLKLLNPKEWLLVAGLLATSFLAWHLYSAGEQRIEKKDAALKAAAIALNVASANLAEIKEIDLGHVYEKIIQLPPVPSTSLVCHAAAAVKPQAPDSGSESHAASAQLPAGGFDPSGPILTLLRDDDATIAYLQNTVLNLQAELEGKTK